MAIVFHQCEDCRRSRLISAEGAVEVDPECVDRWRGSAREERLEPEAEIEVVRVSGAPGDVGEPEIDRPNPPALARRVKLRDGDRCANPACGSRGGHRKGGLISGLEDGVTNPGLEQLHAHHIVFRANGGRTIAENEVTVCTTCHALIHAGLLRVTGTPWEGIRWEPRSSALVVETRSAAAALDRIPNVTVASAPADTSVNHDMSADAKAAKATEATEATEEAIQAMERIKGLIGALTNLGIPQGEAMRRLRRAHEQLAAGEAEFSDSDLIRLAISG